MFEGPVTHTITHVQRTKNEQVWSVRCDLLDVRQNSLMIYGAFKGTSKK